MKNNKILLIQPPMTLLKNEMPSVTFPLGIAYIAGYLEKKGFDVSVIDCVVLGQDRPKQSKGTIHFGIYWDEIEERIREIAPDVVGVSCLFSSQAHNAHKVAEIVKKIAKEQKKNIHVVFGGAHPSSVPESVLKDRNVDAAILGEGEETFYQYVKNINSPDKLKQLDGFGFKFGGKQIINPKTKFIEDLDKLPFPARHLFPMELYFSAEFGHGVDKMREPISSMITSRGCPRNCVFCSIHCVWGRQYRTRSAKNVADEIELLVKKYGVREIHFEDDNLTLNKQRTIEICKEIIRRKLDIKWTTPNGVALWTLDRKVLGYMKKAGCYKLCFGIESGDPETQKFIKKIIPLEMAKEVIKEANKIGIWTHGFFVIGFPFETKKSMDNTLKFAIKSDLDFASFFLATPYPKTELYNIMRQKKMIKDISWDSLRVSSSSIRTKYFTSKQLQKIQTSMFMKFVIFRFINFLNPVKFWYRIKRMKSKEDFKFVMRFFNRFLQILGGK